MKILGFTGSRAEYYLQRLLFQQLEEDPNIDFRLVVSGGIPSEVDLVTLDNIKKDGFRIEKEIALPSNHLEKSHTQSIAYILKEVEPTLVKWKPDAAIVYADRYESFAFSIACFHNNIVTLHLEAGDITEGGTYDDQVRHSISKFSHLFCTSTKKGVDVLECLGEEKWRICHTGLLSYETLKDIPQQEAEIIADSLGLRKNSGIIIATHHPIPSKPEITAKEINELLKSLKTISKEEIVDIIITSPNDDAGSEVIQSCIKSYMPEVINCKYIHTLGGLRYHALLSLAKSRPVIVCGNSSSIIKEVPFYGAHGINVGERQRGRESASTQTDVEATSSKISNIIRNALRTNIDNVENPYYMPNSSQAAYKFLREMLSTKSKSELLSKKWAGHQVK